MIFLVPLTLALACLLCSIVASTRNPRHETIADQQIRHLIATTCALWAIAFLLLGIYVR